MLTVAFPSSLTDPEFAWGSGVPRSVQNVVYPRSCIGSQFCRVIWNWQSSQSCGKPFLFLINRKDTTMVAALFTHLPASHKDTVQQPIWGHEAMAKRNAKRWTLRYNTHIFQPQHHARLEPDNSSLWVTVLFFRCGTISSILGLYLVDASTI